MSQESRVVSTAEHALGDGVGGGLVRAVVRVPGRVRLQRAALVGDRGVDHRDFRHESFSEASGVIAEGHPLVRVDAERDTGLRGVDERLVVLVLAHEVDDVVVVDLLHAGEFLAAIGRVVAADVLCDEGEVAVVSPRCSGYGVAGFGEDGVRDGVVGVGVGMVVDG